MITVDLEMRCDNCGKIIMDNGHFIDDRAGKCVGPCEREFCGECCDLDVNGECEQCPNSPFGQ